MPKASQGGGALARSLYWPSRLERSAARRPGGWRAWRSVRLGRPKARPQPCARVRWPSRVCVHAFSCTGARRIHPVTEGAARRCWCGEVRHPASCPAGKQARVEARLTHNSHLARRRRAQGHGLPGSSEPLWAATHAARLASGQVQSAWWCARAIAVLAHARPRHALSARPSGNQRRSTRPRNSAQMSPAEDITARRPAHTQDPRTATAGSRA
jgi:hypothetical protein